jgi:hypothetical protein
MVRRHRDLASLATSAFVGTWLLLCSVADAAVLAGKPTADDDRVFPKPAYVRKQVRFWEKVFGKFPSTTVIVHEMDDPDRLIDLIDYRAFGTAANKAGPVPRKEREDVTQ